MNLLSNRESGQAFILVLILLLIGGLMLPPLLGFVSTGLKASQLYEQKTDELYAADAGVEYALWNIINDPSLDALAYGDSYVYPLPQQVNSLPVNVNVTKLTLIEGLLSEEEYEPDRPHEGWCEFEAPAEQVIRDYDQGWVKYSCNVTFRYEGSGNRELVTMGVFFAPFPGDRNLIDGPYDETTIPVMTLNNLESTETKTTCGGFTFIWRWLNNLGPTFDNDNMDGTLSFKFKIYDPNWESSENFVWATFKEQDISYVTNAPGLYKWLIEATAGDTKIRSVVIEDTESLSISILTWEINPPE